MICRLRTFSPKALRVSPGSARWVLVGVALAAGLALSRFWLLLVALDLAYLGMLGHAFWTRRRIARPAAGRSGTGG